jgi:DNA-binding Lrp family transcriptional regulator
LKANEFHEVHALVDMFVDSPMMDGVLKAHAEMNDVERHYEVTGESDIVTLVPACDIQGFGDTLKDKIMRIVGVKSTVCAIVLQAHRGPDCEDRRLADAQA